LQRKTKARQKHLVWRSQTVHAWLGVHKVQVVTIAKIYQLFLQVLRDRADKGGAI